MKKLFPLLSLLAVLFFSACSKNSDTTKPVITVTSPQGNQTFTAGQTIPITAAISDENELHHVHVMVINVTNGGHLMHDEYHPDTKTFTLNKSFTAVAGGVYQIEIGAEDHNQNKATTQLQVMTQ